MRILWVTDEVPDPTLGGGSVRQYHLLRGVTDRAEVDLLVAGAVGDKALRAALHKIIEVSGPDPFHPRVQSAFRGLAALPKVKPAEINAKRRTAAVLRQEMAALSNFDVVHVEHEWLAEVVTPPRVGPPKLITLQNLISARLAQTAATATSPSRRIRLRAAASNALRFERALTRRYDRVITVSGDDAHRIGGAVAVVPNGVDLEVFRMGALPPQPRMVFTATWSWQPNEEGAIWACRELLPRVRARLPDAELALVGRQPPASVTALTELDGVTGHFDVPEVAPYLEHARVALVPLRVGSGTRLKALEAMAAGRPLVGTGIGLEGLGLVDGVTAHIAETAEEMAARVLRLCTEDDHARHMAQAARRWVEQHHSWGSAVDRLMVVMEEAVGG